MPINKAIKHTFNEIHRTYYYCCILINKEKEVEEDEFYMYKKKTAGCSK